MERPRGPDPRFGHRALPGTPLRAAGRARHRLRGGLPEPRPWYFSTPLIPQYRRGTCRALNRANAETFANFSDRLTPVAAIPMHTPEEAVSELDYAVNRPRVQSSSLCGLRAEAFRRIGRSGPGSFPVCVLVGPIRDRLRLRLRPRLGQGGGARRLRLHFTRASSA